MKESIVLLVLGACWAGYLGWYWRENRTGSSRRSDGIRDFSRSLGTLGGSVTTTGLFVNRGSLAPRTPDQAARRRREVLMALSSAAVITLLAAVTLGGVAVFVHVLVDLALVAYGYALLQRRNVAAEREIKVHMLYPERVPASPAPQREAVNA
jgi:hypothetical protein